MTQIQIPIRTLRNFKTNINMAQRFGYKGTETALNGLTKWIEENLELTGSAEKRHSLCCKMIVKYGEENIPGYKKYGHLSVAADYVAKKIKWNNKFSDFTTFVLKTNPLKQ